MAYILTLLNERNARMRSSGNRESVEYTFTLQAVQMLV